MPLDRYAAANQRNWDSRADVHAASDFYDLARYRDDPRHLSDVVLFDRDRVGDVTGRRLLHLQCHIGTDTLSWARLGADVTGLDFSERSLAVARDLFAGTATAGTFVAADVYAARDVLDGAFDVVYTGAGALNWLPDLHGWARVIADLLAPGGVLAVTEFHPMAATIDDEGDQTTLRLRYPYFPTAAPLRWDDITTYTDDATAAGITGEQYEWPHSTGELITAVLDAGLRLTSYTEHDGTYVRALPHMVLEDGQWRLPPEQRDLLPLLFSLTARRD